MDLGCELWWGEGCARYLLGKYWSRVERERISCTLGRGKGCFSSDIFLVASARSRLLRGFGKIMRPIRNALAANAFRLEHECFKENTGSLNRVHMDARFA